MSLTKIGSIGINTGIQLAGVTTVSTLHVGSGVTLSSDGDIFATGISTFSEDIKVGSGVTISPDGDVFFTGIATGNGSGLTALNATQLTSGTVPTARLGSGTASSSTFLRGDSTFQTVNTDLVSDTSPQLGGDLASNGNDIIFADNDKAIFGTGSDFKIYHNGTDNYIMASNGHIRFDTGSAELARITSDGKLLIGTTTEGEASADDLTIAGSGNQGITIRSGTSNYGLIYFSDATSGTGEYDGAIEYKHSDNFMVFRTGSSERLRIDSNGRVVIGHTSNIGIANHNGRFQLHGTDYDTATMSIVHNGTDSFGAFLFFASQRSGSPGGSTVLQNNDSVGTIRFHAGDGTDMASYCAAIQVKIDGTPGSNDVPGRIMFSTTADGAAAPTERLRIESDGDFRLSSDNAATNYAFIRGWQSSTGDMVIGADQSATGSGGSNLIFRTRGAEKARILNSGGITFNGDTAAANALDDYEEGTFTPRLGGTSNSSTYYVTGTGWYRKIGSMVYTCVRFNGVDLDNNAAGEVKIHNLPFTANSAASNCDSVTTDAAYFNVVFSTAHQYAWYASNGGTSWVGLVSRDGTSWASWSVSDFHSSGLYINFSGWYQTDS